MLGFRRALGVKPESSENKKHPGAEAKQKELLYKCEYKGELKRELQV